MSLSDVRHDPLGGALVRAPGTVRRLQRICSDDGFVLICALDHITEFSDLLPGPRPVSFGTVVRAKIALVEAVQDVTSAVLVDAHYGLGYLAAGGTLPARVGLMTSLEDGDYSESAPRDTRFRPGWGPAQAAAAGADAVKLLWWYRADADQDLAEAQRGVVSRLVSECAEIGLPLIVEPIWYRLPGEDATQPAWQRRRAEGILESARTVDSLGADVLKLEFPTDLTRPGGRDEALEIFATLDASVSAPWVILSAGAAYEVFVEQVEIATRSGASGYIAGRSLWREAVSAAPQGRAEAIATTVERLRRLNDVTRLYGRPCVPARTVEDLLVDLPEGWYGAS